MTAELFISGPCRACWGAGDNHPYLSVACSYIVNYCIAKYVVWCVLFRDMTSRRSNHNSEFCFAIKFAGKSFVVLNSLFWPNNAIRR